MFKNAVIAPNGRYGIVQELGFGWYAMASPDADIYQPTFRCDEDEPDYVRNGKATEELFNRLFASS